MRPEQRAAVLDLLMRKIDEPAFFAAYGVGRDLLQADVAVQSEKAIRERDADLLAIVGYLRQRFRLPADLEVQQSLLTETWHRQHEEIVRALQYARNPRSIAALRQAIALKPQLEYLDADDYGAFYKKCLWALQDIGTAEAIEAIREYASSEVPALAREAAYRLRKIAGLARD